MKKTLTTQAIVSFVTFFLLIPATAQEWKEYPLYPKHSRVFSNGTCDVWMKIGGGVHVDARDMNWQGKQLVQKIKIDPGKKMEIMFLSFDRKKTGTEMRQPVNNNDAYDVFGEKCADTARAELPEEAKKAFLGNYGMGE